MFWKVMEEEEKEFKTVLFSEVSEMEENFCLQQRSVELCRLPKKM